MKIGDIGIVINNEITEHGFEVGEKIQCTYIDDEGDGIFQNEKGKGWYVSSEEVEIK